MSNQLRCPECGSTNLEYHSGRRYLCRECDLIFIPENRNVVARSKFICGENWTFDRPGSISASDMGAAGNMREVNLLIDNAERRLSK
jgi:rubredoxin